MNDSKDHKAAASGRKHKHGFVLVTPHGEVMAETFRPTRDATKGWLATLEVNGRFERWQFFYRHGWRCRSAELLVDTKPANAKVKGASDDRCRVRPGATTWR